MLYIGTRRTQAVAEELAGLDESSTGDTKSGDGPEGGREAKTGVFDGKVSDYHEWPFREPS